MQIKLEKMLVSGFLAAVLAVTALAPTAHAQAMSAEGVATGGDKVSAIVPQAASLFQVIDIMQELSDEIIACAQNGYFYDQENETCRQGVPPGVVFDDSGSDTYVDVELAYGQDTPGNAQSSPVPGNYVRYGGLDGEDGVTRCLDAGGSVVPCP